MTAERINRQAAASPLSNRQQRVSKARVQHRAKAEQRVARQAVINTGPAAANRSDASPHQLTDAQAQQDIGTVHNPLHPVVDAAEQLTARDGGKTGQACRRLRSLDGLRMPTGGELLQSHQNPMEFLLEAMSVRVGRETVDRVARPRPR